MAYSQFLSCCYRLPLCICPTSALSADLPTLPDLPSEIPEAESLTGSAHSPFRQRFGAFDYVLGLTYLLIQSAMAMGTEHGNQDIEHYFHAAEAHGCSSGL